MRTSITQNEGAAKGISYTVESKQARKKNPEVGKNPSRHRTSGLRFPIDRGVGREPLLTNDPAVTAPHPIPTRCEPLSAGIPERERRTCLGGPHTNPEAMANFQTIHDWNLEESKKKNGNEILLCIKSQCSRSGRWVDGGLVGWLDLQPCSYTTKRN